MKPAPIMFAAIIVVIFLVLLMALLFWLQVFPGPYPTSNPAP